MSSNKIVLTCSDGESFEVEEVLARKLQIVEKMIEKDCPNKAITLQNVTVKILALVIVYCKIHADDDHVDASEEVKKKLKDWDEEFILILQRSSNFLKLLAISMSTVVVFLISLANSLQIPFKTRM
ncbi:hypothetical protein CARUB_v10018961mg [Capsella rubella]|uniref:SKP1 component POZ domain-containing protein n=1 Tax=Capsella rubella TaxID=81985 RepID=R0HNV3_9BRAS|nr:hypothetical protein CARUB_v10018961mg [Capsella rubella]